MWMKYYNICYFHWEGRNRFIMKLKPEIFSLSSIILYDFPEEVTRWYPWFNFIDWFTTRYKSKQLVLDKANTIPEEGQYYRL